jgi:hypothetical protein
MIRPSTSVLRAVMLIALTTAAPASQRAGAQSTDRERILNSADWKQTMQELQQWSSIQQIYDKEQLATKRQELDEKIAGMSAAELSDFLTDLKQKLKILNSPEAREARQFLDETMAVAAPQYAKKIRAQLPDVADLTPAQLQLQLDRYQDRIARKQQLASEFEQQREDQAKQIREQRIRDQQARLKAQLSAESLPRSNYNFNPPKQKIRTYEKPYRPIRYPFLWGGYRW